MTKFVRKAFLQFLLAKLAAGEMVVDGRHVLLMFFHDLLLSSVEQKQLLFQQFKHTEWVSRITCQDIDGCEWIVSVGLVVKVIFP